jgi:hypothetical protein
MKKPENRIDEPMTRERGTGDDARTLGKKRPTGVQDGIGVHGDVGVLRTG